MLSNSAESGHLDLHDQLFGEASVLFLKLAKAPRGKVEIKNNLPQLAKLIFQEKKVRVGDDLLEIKKTLAQLRDDGYDLGSVIAIIGRAYNDVLEKKDFEQKQKRYTYGRTAGVTPDFADIMGTRNQTSPFPGMDNIIDNLFKNLGGK